MIILFEESEHSFKSLGLGVLKDAMSCSVSETLNDTYELEMVYPINGALYSELRIDRIIFCKPNPYSEEEPFRIHSISKPINGLVTVRAFHISYDTNGIIVAPFSGQTIKDVFDNLQVAALIDSDKNRFILYTDKTDTKKFKTNGYFNLRSVLMGSTNSILDTYEGEFKFNRFNIYLLKARGSNKGAQIRYAKNLKDITHAISYERLYNKVYPFYHKEQTTSEATTTTDEFKKVYIVGPKLYQDGWLSYEENGEPYHPVDESPVQVATEGEYFNKVYTWSTTSQRYVERVYNETVTLIDSVGNLFNREQAPSWIYIDWSGLPYIVCRANTDGYFKLATETTWTKRNKGDVIFENSIKDAASNLIIYFAEVIPIQSTSTVEESTTVTHVELPNKIIEINTDEAKNMKFDRTLALDLTGEFDETPTVDKLEAKAKELIEKNKIGKYKYETSVSFVDLSATTEASQYKNLEKIELGDIVKVTYEELGVDLELRVIKTVYDVMLNRYDKIDLGEKPEKISGQSIQNGDNVSSLTNDADYADTTTVNKLIAKTVTADYIQALNAKLTKAQIEELTTARLKVTGMIEATQFELDTLVAKMLTAENAVIKQTLEAGTIKVAGDITIKKGAISIYNNDGTKKFVVTRDGDVEANSVTITGGAFNINDNFSVTNNGILTARGAEIQGYFNIVGGSLNINDRFIVDDLGNMTARNATILGGSITIKDGSQTRNVFVANSSGVTIYGGSILIEATTGAETFKVDTTGKLTAKSVEITGGTISIVKPNASDPSILDTFFKVDQYGNLQANSVDITGGQLKIGNDFEVTNQGILTATGATITGNVTINAGEITISSTDTGTSFRVDKYGALTANSVNITGGQLKIGNKFEVTKQGVLTATGATITGDVTINKGEITIESVSSGTSFKVDQNGNLTANSVIITGGDIEIERGSIHLGTTNGYILDSLSEVSVIYYILKEAGETPGDPRTEYSSMSEDISNLRYQNLPNGISNVEGTTLEPGTRVPTFDTRYQDAEVDLTDTWWYIGTYVYNGVRYDRWICIDDPDTEQTGGDPNDWDGERFNQKFILCPQVVYSSASNFSVDSSGNVTAYSMAIKGGSFNINNKFIVTAAGALTASDATITGGQITITKNGVVTFRVTDQGVVTATDITITGGKMNIGTGNTSFAVDKYGALVANGANITGTVNVTGGYVDLVNPASGHEKGVRLDSDGLTIRSTATNRTELELSTLYTEDGSTGIQVNHIYSRSNLLIRSAENWTYPYANSYATIFAGTPKENLMYPNTFDWQEGIIMSVSGTIYYSQEDPRVIPGKYINSAKLYIGYTYGNSGSSQVSGGFPNDTYCPSGFMRDKYGPLLSIEKVSWPDSDYTKWFNMTGNVVNKGLSSYIGRISVGADGWSSVSVSSYFSYVVAVVTGYQSLNKYDHSGVEGNADYYLEYDSNGNILNVWFGNDRTTTTYISFIIIGVPK